MKSSDSDAARIWHGLDRALTALCEARKGYEEAGREDLLECLEELVSETAAGRENVEGEVLDDLEDRAGRPA